MHNDVFPSDPSALGKHELLTPREAAEYLRVSKSYLDKLRVYGGGPRFLRVGRRKILYRRPDLDAWLASQSFDSTREYQASLPRNPKIEENKNHRTTINRLRKRKIRKMLLCIGE